VQESESILEHTLLNRLLLAERINSALLKEFEVKYSALPMVFSNYFLYAFFWVLPRHLNFICRHFGTLRLFHIHRPVKMEQTVCSETSAYKIQTPGNYPEESIQHLEHGESLKSRILIICCKLGHIINLILR